MFNGSILTQTRSHTDGLFINLFVMIFQKFKNQKCVLIFTI